ncbi:RHS repeat-associated core domain-containing protein [Pseudomonas sp. Irchel s3h17]|uniref:RHS repeat-associated core domain-containing protein n=1 Tax=Pseudomonas sp. Irchel s3h17 TaxID=2009182 RepID=UPI000BA37D1E|nr:RHS repeat-associated core domain-containing protein [Pseudomonas sp. Irchel s3h17]
MPLNQQTLLCRYRYDPLDRLADCTPTAQASTQRFYLKDRLSTEIQGVLQHSIMQHEDQLLAQQQRQDGTQETRLLTTDQQRSVLAILDVARPNHLAYTPYGHRIPENGLLSLLGFNGEQPDPVTGHYLLGNGYRAFNPVLMRFNSPDSWSPFGKGGLNGYAYCVGDPVNRHDPTGHTPKWLKTFLRSIKFMKKNTPIVNLDSTSAASTPLQKIQRPRNTSIGSERISNDQANLSEISKTEPLNITKEEAIEKISALRELQKHTTSQIEYLGKVSNDTGTTIKKSTEKKYTYGRPSDHETSPSNTLELIHKRNSTREVRAHNARDLYNIEKLIKKYSLYIQ